MPTKILSTYKNGQVLDATHFLPVSISPCTIFSFEGDCSSTTGTNYYIQFLPVSQANAVSGTTLPLLSLLAVPSALATGVNGFSFVYPNGLDTARMSFPVPSGSAIAGENTSPVYAAMSSTATVYTAVAGNTDLTVTIEQSVIDLPNQTRASVGSNASLNVWTDSATNTNHRLVSLFYDNTGGSDVFVQVSSFSPSLGTLPLFEWKVLANAIVTFTFGGGRFMQQNDALYVPHYGCFVRTSDTPLTYTASASVPTTITSTTISL